MPLGPKNKKPAWAPNESQRKQMKAMSAIGLTLHQMAVLLGGEIGGISENMLKMAIKKDNSLRLLLEIGKDEAGASVRNTAYKMATSGKSPAMTIFWLKTREKWFEQPALDGDGQVIGNVQLIIPSNNRK